MKIQNNEITEQRAAFLPGDYSRGFIQYCQIEPEVVGKSYFQSKVKIETQHR